MLDSIYNMTLKIILKSRFGVKMTRFFLSSFMQCKNESHYVTLLNL